MTDLIDKIKEFQNKKGADLSMEEDLSIAVMNLISLEEHFYFTAQKTKKDEYYEMLKKTREIRKKMLAKMIPEGEGETWCISKHLLSTTMRLIEVGTKYQNLKKEKEAKDAFESAYETYNLFWAVRLKIINLSAKKSKLPELIENSSKPWKIEDIVGKMVDCCRE